MLTQSDETRPCPKELAEWLWLLGRFLRAESERHSVVESLTGREIVSQYLESVADRVCKEANEIWQEH